MSVLVVDKPAGPTSFDVVRQVRRGIARLWRGRRPRVGHGGTLDPLASGVLPVCIGEATKLAPFLLEADKEYETVVRFGVETDTFDAAGRPVAVRPVGGLDAGRIEAALGGLRGDIEQVPPMYSALKRDGRPLYSYARAGETVERAPRRVRIHALELLEVHPPDRARLRVRCSKGTYVRVLAHDLGRALGVGGHVEALRRTASGPFRLSQAVTLAAFDAAVAAGRLPPLVSLDEALAHLPALPLDAHAARAVGQGQRLPCESLGAPGQGAGPLRALGPDGRLVAIVACDADGKVRILRGFGSPPDDFPGATVD